MDGNIVIFCICAEKKVQTLTVYPHVLRIVLKVMCVGDIAYSGVLFVLWDTTRVCQMAANNRS